MILQTEGLCLKVRLLLTLCFMVNTMPGFSETAQTKVTIIGSLHKYHKGLSHYSFDDLKSTELRNRPVSTL